MDNASVRAELHIMGDVFHIQEITLELSMPLAPAWKKEALIPALEVYIEFSSDPGFLIKSGRREQVNSYLN